MEKRKVTLELRPSKSFNTIGITIHDEEIDFINEDDFKFRVDNLYKLMQEEVDKQFKALEEKNKR